MLIHDDVMDCVTKFDIELDKDIFYAGETLTGHIIVQNTENIKVQGGCPPHRGSCTGLIQKTGSPFNCSETKKSEYRKWVYNFTHKPMKVEVLYRKGVHIPTNASKRSRKGLLINLKMPNILF